MEEWIVFKSNHNGKSSSEIAYEKLGKKNKEIIKNWLKEKAITSKSEKRKGNRRRVVIKLLTFVKKDYDKIDYSDYVNVAEAISNSKESVYQKNDTRFFIKRFLKDAFDNWEKKFKKFSLLKSQRQTDNNKISAKELLTELELDKLITNTTDMKHRAMLVCLYEGACRPEELIKLKWADVDFTNNLIYLYSSKTGKKRAVPIDKGINHLTRLKKEINSTEEDLVFPNSRGNKLSINGLNIIIQRLGKKAGVKKRLWAYLFRHTRLSFLITKLSPKVYEEFAGHSLATGMKHYAHLSKDAIIKEMNEKVFEIEELSIDEKKQLEEIKNKLKHLEKKMPELFK